MSEEITIYSPDQVIVFRPRRRPLSLSFLEHERLLHPDLGEEELVAKAQRMMAGIDKIACRHQQEEESHV